MGFKGLGFKGLGLKGFRVEGLGFGVLKGGMGIPYMRIPIWDYPTYLEPFWGFGAWNPAFRIEGCGPSCSLQRPEEAWTQPGSVRALLAKTYATLWRGNKGLSENRGP